MQSVPVSFACDGQEHFDLTYRKGPDLSRSSYHLDEDLCNNQSDEMKEECDIRSASDCSGSYADAIDMYTKEDSDRLFYAMLEVQHCPRRLAVAFRCKLFLI